jgi:hypothetical protein
VLRALLLVSEKDKQLCLNTSGFLREKPGNCAVKGTILSGLHSILPNTRPTMHDKKAPDFG